MEKTFKLRHIPSELYDKGAEVINILKNCGHKAFMVGGCVRDTALAIPPEEYDIATSALPDEVIDIFPRTAPIGKSFGVVLVIHDGFEFEVATFRTEERYSDGRRPESVSFGADEQSDVLRRDFTINALLYDPETEEAVDYVGAMKDIDAKIVRTIGNPFDRFEEDKLRMLRAVRFGARFSYVIEPETLAAIKQYAHHIGDVSRERIRDELTKIATQNQPGKGLRMLLDTGLLRHILPNVAKMDDVRQPPQFHPEGDVFTHTCMVLDEIYKYADGSPSVELAMGALLHDVGKPPTYAVTDRIRFNGHDRVGANMTIEICKELRFSRKQTERIADLVRDHLKFKDVTKMRIGTLKKFMSIPHFDDHLALNYADCSASHGDLTAYRFVNAKLSEFSKEEIKPAPLLTGYDLIEMGYKPGPLFNEILGKVEDAQLEGTILNKAEAKRIVEANFPL